jgi:FkbM family methyltransferase
MPLSTLFRRRPKVQFAEFGHQLSQFDLAKDGRVQYAQWLHPRNPHQVIEQQQVDALRQFIKPGDFVIDIGAYCGDTGVPMALAAGATGCTLALEPNPHVFKVLQANAALNRDKTNIIPRNCAATEADGEFVFHYSDAGFCNGGFKSQQRWRLYKRRYPLTVQGKNLLHILRTEFAKWLPKLTYVKVDAEGYDRAVLASILPVLQEHKPVIRSEVFRKLVAKERYALHELLANLGYTVHRYTESGELAGEKLERGDMTKFKHFDILALPNRKAAKQAA